jgi:hypothetical protein
VKAYRTIILLKMSNSLRLRFVTDSCLLVVKQNGKMVVLYTPFRVLTIVQVEGLTIHTQVYVDAVFHHQEYRLCFLINGKLYPYNYFQINVSF